jgi:hypothetical protein
VVDEQNIITEEKNNNLISELSLLDLNKDPKIEAKSFEDCAEVENNKLIRWKKEIE